MHTSKIFTFGAFWHIANNFFGYATHGGDLLVSINVYIPEVLSKDERKIIEKLKPSKNFSAENFKTDSSFFDNFKGFFN